jgi:sulfur relay (sulfurtransferase) DsrF/TusC family protein
MKVLSVIETAYRATLEEQDDPILWVTGAMRGAGADLSVLLQGNAVNYVVAAQYVRPLAFGARQQKHGPQLADDVSLLVGKGVPVYVVADDLRERGVADTETIAGLTRVSRADLPRLYDGFDGVWHW